MIKDNNATIINGDCLEELTKLQTDSIDLVLTDLPYGMTENEWDTIIPFKPLWHELNRICKLTTPMVFNSMQPFTTKLIASNINNFKYQWYWQKNKATGFFNIKQQPLRNIEDIVIFYRNQCCYNPQMTKGKSYITTRKAAASRNYGEIKEYTIINKSGDRYPKQLQSFNSIQDTVHPTQKPVDLIKYLVSTYTNENDLVLDFTMGSGTTGVASLELNRRFIGIELNKEYFNIAQDRLNKIQHSLFV